jgi:hypothetical protein
MLERVDHHPNVAGRCWNGKALEGHDDPLTRDKAGNGKVGLALVREEAVRRIVPCERPA